MKNKIAFTLVTLSVLSNQALADEVLTCFGILKGNDLECQTYDINGFAQPSKITNVAQAYDEGWKLITRSAQKINYQSGYVEVANFIFVDN